MRQTQAPGHIIVTEEDGTKVNKHKDWNAKDRVGTVWSADMANDIQDEILGVQKAAGLAEAPGTQHQLLQSINILIKKYVEDKGLKTTIENSKKVGDLFFSRFFRRPVAWDPSNPSSYFPALCLSPLQTDKSQILDDRNWPDLSPKLRAEPFTSGYTSSAGLGQSYVSVRSIRANTAPANNRRRYTLTLTTDQTGILFHFMMREVFLLKTRDIVVEFKTPYKGLAGEFKVISEGPHFWNLNLATISAANLHITVQIEQIPSVSTVPPAIISTNGVQGQLSFYPHKILGETTKSQIFEVENRSLMTTGKPRGNLLALAAGAMHDAAMTDHIHEIPLGFGAGFNGVHRSPAHAAGEGKTNSGALIFPTRALFPSRPAIRAWGEPQPRAYGAYLYMWGGRYIA